jgi:hypothetical protein
MCRKYTQEQVALIFTNAGCELLSTYYTAGEPVQYRCSCGDIAFISVSHLLEGKRCKKCGREKQAYTQEQVEQFFKDQGCELLDTYVNSHTRIKYRCSCGNISIIMYRDFQRGYRCKVCGNIRHSKTITGSGNPNWNSNREQVRLNREMRNRQCNVLNNCFGRLGTKKEGHTDAILGYTPLELDNHLRTFSRYIYLVATGTLSIDHILPMRAFQDHGIDDPKVICALSNLQPLSKSENSEKNAWYTEDDFIAYCQTHNIIYQQKEQVL